MKTCGMGANRRPRRTAAPFVSGQHQAGILGDLSSGSDLDQVAGALHRSSGNGLPSLPAISALHLMVGSTVPFLMAEVNRLHSIETHLPARPITSRKPVSLLRRSRLKSVLQADRQNEPAQSQLPPRATRVGVLSDEARIHSRTFPCISCRPHELARYWPTSQVASRLGPFGRSRPNFELLYGWFPLKLATRLSKLAPNADAVVVPERHPYSHSSSVGSRYLELVGSRPASCSAVVSF